MARITHTTAGNADDREYTDYIDRMGRRVNDLITAGEPLFITNADLWPIYLDSFESADERQYHNCSACRRFVRRYGALTAISGDGRVTPALWYPADAPDGYRKMAQRLYWAVRGEKITGVFIPSSAVLGDPGSNGWRHYSITVPPGEVWSRKTMTAGQAMAEKRQDYINVSRALGEFGPRVVAQALSLLESDTLYRSEKVLGPVQWLADLHEARDRTAYRSNATWRAVAKAPAGFCHPRSSMAGTLLEDLANGVDVGAAQRRFRAKMHPLQYQRPQAAPSPGAIERAEEIVEQMGIARSFERRFARVDECQLLWSPPEIRNPGGGGVFAHLRRGEDPAGAADGGPIAWDRFVDRVLPGAVDMRIGVPGVGGFFALVTAVHDDAPPILQWDSADNRNPVSWYTYCNGSLAHRFGLTPGLLKIVGVVVNPAQWSGPVSHYDDNAVLLIDGAKDQSVDGELALFPEILRSELREVRPVIEAHSKARCIEPTDGQNAAGLIAKGAVVLVTDRTGITTRYLIDRWS